MRLEIDALKKTLNNVPLFDGATLNVARGETVVIYGRSGSGKSVLLNILSGALSADGGDIRVDGQSVIDAPPEERNIGMAFQNFALYPHMSSFDNIASPLRSRKNSPDDVQQKVESVARLLKIDTTLSHFPQALSNGQKQRTSLARALVAEPAVLLLDDPLRNVDAKLRYEMRLEMPDLFQRIESAVIYVTQDSREAMALADRIAVLHDGKFIQVGPPEEVYDFPCNIEVGNLLGEPTLNLFPCETLVSDDELFINPANCPVAITRHYDLTAGVKCIAAVRPEDVFVGIVPGDSHSIEATVTTVMSTNIRILLSLKTASEEEIVAACPEQDAEQYVRGQRVYVSFITDHILLFTQGEERLIEQISRR